MEIKHFEMETPKRYIAFQIKNSKENREEFNAYDNYETPCMLETEDGKKIWMQHSHPSQVEDFDAHNATKADYVFCCYPAYIKKRYPELNVLFDLHPLQCKYKLKGNTLLFRIDCQGDYDEDQSLQFFKLLGLSIDKYIF